MVAVVVVVVAAAADVVVEAADNFQDSFEQFHQPEVAKYLQSELEIEPEVVEHLKSFRSETAHTVDTCQVLISFI